MEDVDIFLDTMVSNYNNAIQRQSQIEEYYKQHKSEPVAENESDQTSDQIIAMLEKYQRVSVAERNKMLKGIKLDADDVGATHMSERICGCRFTAKLIFTMILLHLTKPIGKRFETTYNTIFKQPLVEKIMFEYISSSRIDDIRNERHPHFYTLLPDTELCICVILSDNISEYGNLFSSEHNFVVFNRGDGNCNVLSSSWRGVGDVSTPISNKLEKYEDLKLRLMPENLRNKENAEDLFGSNINLTGNLEIIFISKEAFIALSGGKKKTKKRKKRKKRKTLKK